MSDQPSIADLVTRAVTAANTGIDIKPWMQEFGPRGPIYQPEWSRELMSGYWTDGTSSTS